MKTKPIISLKTSDETFIIIPSITFNFFKGKRIRIYQIGILWGLWNLNFGLGFNLPEDYPIYELHQRFVALCRWGIKARKYQPTTKLN